MDVKGQGAIVTGGGSGLGTETARHLAAAGAKVAVLDLAAEAAQAVAREIGGLGLACDVGSAAEAEAAVAAGRPICPRCSLPIDPDGHVCPALNGDLRHRR